MELCACILYIYLSYIVGFTNHASYSLKVYFVRITQYCNFKIMSMLSNGF